MTRRAARSQPRARRPADRRVALALGNLLAAALVAACGSAAPSSLATTAGEPMSSGPPAPTIDLGTDPPATPAPTGTPAPPPDLADRPLVWLAPLPILPTGPGREYTGSTDFMRLFDDAADWGSAAGVDVVKLYGEWVAYSATDAELASVIRTQREAGRALAVEMGPLEPDGCGNGVEGFAGLDEARRIAGRIEAAGGRIDLVAMDEPWFFGHVYAGPGACRWPLDRIARGVAAFEAVMRQRFPDVIVGDTEALPRDVDPAGLLAWLDAYRSENGRSLPFVHLDLDFGRNDWATMVRALDAGAGARGVDTGIIWFGDPSDRDDREWFGTLAASLLALEAAGGPPDHVLFQSWQDRPDRVLPATDPTTWTGFVGRYLAGPSNLVELLPPSNLAVGADVRASTSLPDASPLLAVDGNPATTWSAGTGPPSWIEIDLGAAKVIAMVRLRIAQYPAGATVHRLLGMGPDTGGKWVVLHVFRGETSDAGILEWEPDGPRTGIRRVRVETTTSPSWVSWREVEVIAPER